MLARSAMTPDHLPASQSVFLSRLIEVKSTEMPINRMLQQTYMPEMIDFEAFGQSLEGDQSKTQWPPAPFNFDLSSFASIPQSQSNSHNLMGHDNQLGQEQDQANNQILNGVPMTSGLMTGNAGGGSNDNGNGSNNNINTVNTETSSGNTSNLPTDLDGWVAATQFPMPGLSLGMGSNFGQDDLLFTQDSFWKSIFEGQPQNQGQGVGMV